MRRRNIPDEKKHLYFLLVLVCITILYIGYLLDQIGIHMFLNRMNSTSIPYDAFSQMILPSTWIEKVKKDRNKVDDLTISMMIHNFDLSGKRSVKKSNLNKLKNYLSNNKSYQELKSYYDILLRDIVYFPIPFNENGESYVSYENSWHAVRSYGGVRKHEGTDLMPEYNIAGLYPIMSITDGVVEKIGWLEKGGYRIGIRSTSGVYFYYAHLESYAENIKKGDKIKAGQLLGFMGDTGYGPEVTTGMFDVHLHLGIYLDTPNGELSVNPYYILRYLESQPY